jgi:hypothetical protein
MREMSSDSGDPQLSEPDRCSVTDTLILEGVVACDSANKRKIMDQLTGYARFIQKRIMYEKYEKGELLTTALTPTYFPDYFYSVSIKNVSCLFGCSTSKYEIKIRGPEKALRSAIESLVFGNFYNTETCSFPSSLVEYAVELINGNVPTIIRKIEFNY